MILVGPAECEERFVFVCPLFSKGCPRHLYTTKAPRHFVSVVCIRGLATPSCPAVVNHKAVLRCLERSASCNLYVSSLVYLSSPYTPPTNVWSIAGLVVVRSPPPHARTARHNPSSPFCRCCLGWQPWSSNEEIIRNRLWQTILCCAAF